MNRATSPSSNRARLIADTRKRYVYRRQQKLDHDLNFEIKLELKFIKTKARDPVHEQFILNTKSEVQDYQQLFELYYQKLNRLLILGEPGSGKTMLLLRLGEYLMDKAEKDEQHPIPIIFNLANWHGDSEDFYAWLVKQLRHAAGEAGISGEYAEELMKNYQVLPLLDGLDEVREPLRKDCLDAVEEYLDQLTSRHTAADLYPQLVLCSRITEFEALETGAPVLDTIKIQPLTKNAVRETLQALASEYNRPAGQLLLHFDQFPLLEEALRTAFYVHTALSLTESNREVWQAFDLETATPSQIREQIIETYLQQQLDLLDSKTQNKRDELAYYLSWLAQNLHTNKQSVSFELIDLQLSWWENTRKNRWIYGLVSGLVVGLVLGLVGELVFGRVGRRVVGLVLGLVGGLALGLLEAKKNIKYDEITQFNFAQLNLAAFFRIIKNGLIYGAVGALFLGLIGRLVIGLVIGLVSGLVVGLVREITTYNTFPKISRPWQKITSGIKKHLLINGSAIMISILIISVLIEFEVIEELIVLQDLSLVSVLFGGALLALTTAFLSDSSFRFFIIYLLLWRKGFIPTNLVKFLNEVAKTTGLMERDGGQWRFRHQLIHDAFTQHWVAEHTTSPQVSRETLAPKQREET